MSTIWLDLLGAEVRTRGRAFRTRTIETGSQNPKKLILIHGIGGHAEAYAKNMQRLGESYHAIAIDLLWHGLSSKPAYTPDMLPMYARQIIDILDDLGVESASIEGESLGGWVTLYTALHYPERIDRIVLNTTAGINWNRNAVAIDDDSGINALRERSLAAIRKPSRETIRKRLEWLMAYPDRVTEELVDLRYALYTRPDLNESLEYVFSNGLATKDHPHRIQEAQLPDVKSPALVLWSDHNPGAGADAGERLASLIPGSAYFCVTDAGHWPQWEQPAEHDRAVLSFLHGEALEPSAVSS